MTEGILYNDKLVRSKKTANEATYAEMVYSRESPGENLEKTFLHERNAGEYSSPPTENWCESVSSFSSVPRKQPWKRGNGKFSQTLNNVRTTFGFFSQRIRQSLKKRQALNNLGSPSSPVTPCTRSRVALGRTPIKLYSPFSIDTPTGKENQSYRFTKDKNQLDNSNVKGERKKFRRIKLDLGVDAGETKMGETMRGNFEENDPIKKSSNDLLQTQIGIYEFHSIASKIVQNSLRN